MAVQFAAAQPAAVQQSPVELGKAFVEECLVVWDRSAPLSTRPLINEAFLQWCIAHKQRAKPHEAFRGVLEAATGRGRTSFQNKAYHNDKPLRLVLICHS